MFLVAWISLGVISAIIYSGVIYRRQPSLAADLVIGVMGAMVGGFIYTVAVGRGEPELTVGSTLGVFLSSMLILGAFHRLRRMGRGR